MDTDIDTLKPLLTGMGFTEARIDAALGVLSGHDAEPVVELLTLTQLAKALGISTSTVLRIAPPHHWVGKRKRFRLQEVMDFMQDQQRAIT